MTDRNIEFWDLEGEECLSCTDMDEAIELILDGDGDIKDLPETIEICGYAYKQPNVKKEAEHALERILEGLDEEYGNPDGHTEVTDSMKKAAEEFVAAILSEYTVWTCEIAKRETINVREWIQNNRPDWLEENKCESARMESRAYDD